VHLRGGGMVPAVDAVRDTLTLASTSTSSSHLALLVNLSTSTGSGGEGAAPPSSSPLVWLVLFSLLILASITLNTLFLVAVVVGRRWSTTNTLIISFFLVNLLDYSLLLVDFSLPSSFPYSSSACSLHQLLLQLAPLLTSGLFLLLVLSCLHPSSPTSSSRTPHHLLVVFAICLLLSLPSLPFSSLSTLPSGEVQCTVDLGEVGATLGLPSSHLHLPTSLYHLLLRALLPLLLPLLLLPLLCRGGKGGSLVTGGEVVALSHGVFTAPLALATTTRCLLAATMAPLPPRTAWVLDVLTTLALLISYFLHLFRPLAAMILEPGLRSSLTSSPYTPVSPHTPNTPTSQHRI